MSLPADMPWRFLRAASTRLRRRNVDLTVEGLDRVPRRGPVIVAARHVHHLYDGAALLESIDRPAHILVALDWMPAGIKRELLARLCRAARWPAVIRTEQLAPANGRRDPEAVRRLRVGILDSVRLLADGRVLIVFPEGYPNIDPNGAVKEGLDEMLPFRLGYLQIAARVRHQTGKAVPIVPAGFAYDRGDRWRVRLALGEPVSIWPGEDLAVANRAVETEVRHLSGLSA